MSDIGVKVGETYRSEGEGRGPHLQQPFVLMWRLGVRRGYGEEELG